MPSGTAPRSSVSSFRPRSKLRCSAADLLRFLACFVCVALVACKPSSTETAADVVVVNAKPRCEKIGVVEGAGGDAQHARADAIDRAAKRGATHILLDTPYWDLQNGMTMLVDGTLFKCPPPGEEFPPAGYP
jgi:hypothetical protein